MNFIKKIESLFKNAQSGVSNVEIDNELINNWTAYAKQIGLSEVEILGMAYFNAAIPTLTFLVKNDSSIISPLKKVVSNYLQSSNEGANVLYIYRECFFNASIKSDEIGNINFDGLPEDFFSDSNNRYLKYANQEETLFKKSGLTLDLIGNIGKILYDYNVNISQAFNLGHQHTIFLFGIHPIATSEAILLSNVLPEYLATLVDSIPKPETLALKSDLWLFTKILQKELADSEYDQDFQAWIWYYHNSLFYENKPGSVTIKEEWDLENTDFEDQMLIQINQSIFTYYRLNQKTGNQTINRTIDLVKKPEDYFNFINEKMLETYLIEIDRKNFRNIGEKTNYLCRVFLKAIEVSFEKFKFGDV
jgi:hypothetical protein